MPEFILTRAAVKSIAAAAKAQGEVYPYVNRGWIYH